MISIVELLIRVLKRFDWSGLSDSTAKWALGYLVETLLIYSLNEDSFPLTKIGELVLKLISDFNRSKSNICLKDENGRWFLLVLSSIKQTPSRFLHDQGLQGNNKGGNR